MASIYVNNSNHIKLVNSYRYNATADKADNYIGTQIAKARNAADLTLKEFKHLLEGYGVNVGIAAMSKWECGETSPNAYQLLAIAQALNIEEDLSYFMSGHNCQLNKEGQLKVASYRNDLIASGRYKATDHPNVIRYRDMPVSYLSASAGTGQFLEEDHFEKISFPEASIPEGADFGIRVSGDSMEPVYQDGQIVWVHLCDHVNIGSVGIFIYDNEGYIKVYDEQIPDADNLENYVDSTGTLHKQPVLLSYNKKYSPRVISSNADFKVIGCVL